MRSQSRGIAPSAPKRQRDRFVGIVVAGCLIVAALFMLSPAMGVFTVPTATQPMKVQGYLTPTSVGTPSGLACEWPSSAVNPTSVNLSWSNAQAWSTTQIQRNVNGGAYANSGSAVAAGTATVTNTSVTTPASNQYGFRAKAVLGTWESAPTNEITDESCKGAINKLFDSTVNSKLNEPEDVAFDSAGNMFIADTANNRIRCVAASGSARCGATAGNIYTYVNTGGTSGTTDSTSAANGKLNGPRGVWVDRHDNLLIADTGNGSVRIVYMAGTQPLYAKSGMSVGNIYTVAGTTGSTGYAGTNISPTDPSVRTNVVDIASDSDDNLFLADGANHRVRCVAKTTKCGSPDARIYDFAGNGTGGWLADGVAPTSTRVATPTGITVNSDGNVIWTDRTNGRLRMVYSNAGETYGITSPTSPSVGNIYTITTATSTPWGVQADSSNNLIVGDSGTNTVKVFFASTSSRYGIATPSDNTYTTVAGSGGGSYNGTGLPITGTGSAAINSPYGVAIDPTNTANIYAVDHTRGVVRKIDYVNGFTFTWAGTAGTATYTADDVPAHGWEISSLKHSTVDSAGNIYFADSGDNRIRKWIPSCACLVVAAGSGGGTSNGDGSSPLAAGIVGPQGVHIDGSGNMYIAETDAHRIRMVPASGMTRFNQSMSAGNIYTIMGNGNQCGAGSAPCGDGGTLASANRLNFPRDVLVDSLNNLIVSDGSNCEIRYVATSTTAAWGLNSGGTLTVNGIYNLGGTQRSCSSGSDGVAATSSTINLSDGITLDGYGNLLLTEANGVRIRLIAASDATMYGTAMTKGHIYNFAGSGSSCGSTDAAVGSATFCNPKDVTYNTTTGAVYVADTGNDLVRKIANGVVTTIAGGGSANPGDAGPGRGATLVDPAGAHSVAGGHLYISQTGLTDTRVIVGPDP